jgi:hypothetical protein
MTWLASAPAVAPPEPAPLDPVRLVESLAREAPARTPFTEVRFSGLLDRPLIARGELEYRGPGELGKRVESPYHEDTRIAAGEVTVQRGERAPRQFSLSQIPELEGFLRGFGALLGGDAAALQRDFTLTARGDSARWRLELTPRDPRLARRVSAIEVDGSGDTPLCFRTREADGDVGVLLVEQLAAAKLPPRPAPAQLEKLCRGGKVP